MTVRDRAHRAAGVRVVIAEDSPTQATQLIFLLEENGYDVLAGRNGREALQLVQEHRPDLLITDVVMPEMDGYELTRALKTDPDLRDTLVIMVTSLTSPNDVFRGLHAGADNFVIKPYDEGTLLTRINYLLSNKALRKDGKLQIGLEIELAGERHFITADRQQILDLLISTYEQAIRLYDELDQRQKDLARSYSTLNALYDITDALNHCHTEADVVASAIGRSVNLPGVHGAWLYLAEGADFRLAGASPTPTGVFERKPGGAGCACRRQFLAGELQSAANVADCDLLLDVVPDGRAVHASIPLVLDGLPIGLLNVVNNDRGPFSEEQIRTLNLVGGQIAAALQRATLHEHLERKVAERTQALQTEVAERRQAEAVALRAGEEFRKANETVVAILDASPLAIISVDRDDRVMTWNAAAERIFGHREADLVGQPLPLLPGAAAGAHRAVFSPIADGRDLRGVEGKQSRKDGTLLEVRASGTRLYDSAGSLRGAVLVLEDVTERKRVDEQLRQAQKMEAIGNLTGGLAHDFNNLLTIITGNLTLFSESCPDDNPNLDLINDAVEAAWRGAELTRQLLAFARRQPLEEKRIKVNDHVGRVSRLMERTLGGNIKITTDLAGDVWPISVDPSQLETSLLNLATNARDAMPDGGSLLIETSNVQVSADYMQMNPGINPGDYVVIAVTDTGTGMTLEILDRIFEPFFTTKAPGSGTGLGLAMVFGFARQTGGQVKAYSEPGRGTTVRIYLPRDVDGEYGEEASGIEHESRGDETVLVVDDNERVRRVVMRQLTELGYRPVEAANAAEALEIVGSRSDLALMITDVVMPDIDGVSLTRAARETRPELAVLYISGFPGGAFSGDRSLPDGAFMISKPFRKDDLARRIRQALSVRKAEEAGS